MLVGGVRPASAAMVEPSQQDFVGEVVQWPGVSGDRQAAVGEINIVKLQRADRSVPGGVDGR
jgi:hypothetical protein